MRRHALVLVHSYYLRDTRARRHGQALADNGWNVDVICARAPGEAWRDTKGSLRIWRMPARRRGGSGLRRIFEYATFALMSFFAVTIIWVTRRHRLVYVLGMPNFIVFCTILPRLAGRRVLLDMRDPFPEFFLAKYDASSSHALFRLLLLEEKLSARFASGVLTAGPSMAKTFERSIPEERLSVVWNSVDPQIFGERPNTSPRPGDRTLVYSGSVTHPYGVDLAVRAVARLHHEIQGMRIRVVGEGDLIGVMEEIARTEGITDLVDIHPQVPLEQVPSLIEGAWLGVQPIRPSPLMEHSLSTKVLEWCQLRLPVVAGRTPPLVALFGEDKILFHDPGDLDGLCACILEAHRNPQGLAERAERARKAAASIRFEEQIMAFLRAAEGP